MKKRIDITPRSRITQALRLLWLRSRERAFALKVANRTCIKCGVKASVAKGKEQKIEVHHKGGTKGIFKEIADIVQKELLVSPDKLECMCPECHEKEHKQK